MSGELPGDRIPALRIGSGAPVDEVLALTIHVVASATIDVVVREAVEELTRAVAGATQWITEAVRGELFCQAVAAVEPSSRVKEVEEYHESPTSVPELVLTLARPPSAIVHAVAREAVDSATSEAVKEVVQAVEIATEWITRALGDELISETIHPEEGVAVHNATEWIAQAVELVAHIADASPSSETSAAVEEERESVDSTQAATAQEILRVSVRVRESSIDDARELAKATAEAAVDKALENVSRAINDASEWLSQAARAELLAQTVVEASPEITHVDEVDENSTASTDSEEPRELPVSAEGVKEVVPALQLPDVLSISPQKIAECHELAVPFVDEVVSSVLHQAVPDKPIDPEGDAYDEEYTPINTPTGEDLLTKSPLPSTRTSEPESQFVPPVVLSGRATPPDSKPTTRRRSPITNKRELGTPTSLEPTPASAPPLANEMPLEIPSPPPMPAPPLVDEMPASLDPPHSTLPPLVLPGIQGAQLSSKMKHQQHKTPRKTPRQTSYPPHRESTTLINDSPRAATTSSSAPNKHTSRAPTSAELQLTPLSSARAAALIYAQQPSSARHHHHKAKKLRGTASQTSPPPSPPPLALPRQPLLEDHQIDSYAGTELPKTHVKHSPRTLSTPGSGAETKADGNNNLLLAPLSKNATGPGTAKSPSPSRTHKNHGHGHNHKGGGGGSSPNKRSGYCQRCVFEGRTCKVNDCLKHQVLK